MATRKRPVKFKHRRVVDEKDKHHKIVSKVKKIMGDDKQNKTLETNSSGQQTPFVNNGFDMTNSQVPGGEQILASKPSLNPSDAQGKQNPVSNVSSPASSQYTQSMPSGTTQSENVSSTQPAQASMNQSASQPSASSFSGGNSSLSDIEPPSGKGKMWLVILVIIIAIASLGGGLYYFREEVMKNFAQQDKTIPEISPTPKVIKLSPTLADATESASLNLDLSKHNIMVLNGSGIAGEAGRVRDILEGEEFVVEDVGNADGSDHEKTVIRAKKEVSKEFLDKLKSVLEKSHSLGSDEVLDDTEETEIVIILGSEKP